MQSQTPESTPAASSWRRGFLLATALVALALITNVSFGTLLSWGLVSDVGGCAAEGRVCAEWPIMEGLAYVCCIEPYHVGTSVPPSEACVGDIGFLRAN